MANRAQGITSALKTEKRKMLHHLVPVSFIRKAKKVSRKPSRVSLARTRSHGHPQGIKSLEKQLSGKEEQDCLIIVLYSSGRFSKF